MLASKYRFHRRSSIAGVYRFGKTSRQDSLVLRALLKDGSSSQAAVVVSKKVAKKAYVRNRIRRRIYEALREIWPMIIPGSKIVVIVTDERLATVSFAELRQTILTLLSKTGHIKG